MSDQHDRPVRVLVTVPRKRGGVTAFWDAVVPELDAEVSLIEVGSGSERPSWLTRFAGLAGAVRRMWVALSRERVDAVVVNPSLDPLSLVRDGTLVIMARCRGARVVAMFHGWQSQTEALVDHGLRGILRLAFGRADATIVLSSGFRDTLRRWGWTCPVHTTTTVVDPYLSSSLRDGRPPAVRGAGTSPRVLYLSRVTRDKGIFVTLDAVRMAREQAPDSTLIVAGDGLDRDAAQMYAADMPWVEFRGDVRGDQKRDVFIRSDVYLLPTRHGEGMPTTVLEAMYAGLAVVTRPVGGLADFLRDGENALVTDSLDPREYARLTVRLCNDDALRIRLATQAKTLAQAKFTSAAVAERMDRVLAGVVEARARTSVPPSDSDWFAE